MTRGLKAAWGLCGCPREEFVAPSRGDEGCCPFRPSNGINFRPAAGPCMAASCVCPVCKFLLKTDIKCRAHQQLCTLILFCPCLCLTFVETTSLVLGLVWFLHTGSTHTWCSGTGGSGCCASEAHVGSFFFFFNFFGKMSVLCYAENCLFGSRYDCTCCTRRRILFNIAC